MILVLGIKRISFDTFFVGTVCALHCRFGLSDPIPLLRSPPSPPFMCSRFCDVLCGWVGGGYVGCSEECWWSSYEGGC